MLDAPASGIGPVAEMFATLLAETFSRRLAAPIADAAIASAELMLLHVYQGDEPKAQAFPPEVIEALARVAEEDAAGAADAGRSARELPASGSQAPVAPIPGSRRMELRSRS